MTTQNKVYLQRVFNCTPEILFQWLIDPKRIVQWFGPQNTTVGAVSCNPVVNGQFSIELLRQTAPRFTCVGRYLTIEPPHKLVFTFAYDGLNSPDSEVSILLTSKGNQTHMAFTQSFETVPANMEKRTVAWEAMFTRMDEKITADQ